MSQPPGTVAMIDVSAAQGEMIAWESVYESGVRAVYVEHGVGNDLGNACREAQVRGAQASGLRVGRYDFVYPIGYPGAGRDAPSQGRVHADLAVPGVRYDLPAVLDLEWPEPSQWTRWGCSATQIVQWVLAYSFARPDVTRIYTMPSFVVELGHPPEFARFDLWLAEWTQGAASVPAPWRDWAAWQYANAGDVPGIHGPVDHSWLRVPSELPTLPDLAA